MRDMNVSGGTVVMYIVGKWPISNRTFVEKTKAFHFKSSPINFVLIFEKHV